MQHVLFKRTTLHHKEWDNSPSAARSLHKPASLVVAAAPQAQVRAVDLLDTIKQLELVSPLRADTLMGGKLKLKQS